MFRVIGDVIEFDGERVGWMRTGLPATLRAKVIDALQTADPEWLERLEKECGELKQEADHWRHVAENG